MIDAIAKILNHFLLFAVTLFTTLLVDPVGSIDFWVTDFWITVLVIDGVTCEALNTD